MTIMKPFWKRPKFYIWALIVICLAVVVFQNVEPVQLDLLFWNLPSMPKLVLILISMLLGCLLTLWIQWEIRHHRRKAEESRSEQDI